MTDTTITYAVIGDPTPALRITRIDDGNTTWTLDLIECDARFHQFGLHQIIDRVGSNGIDALFDTDLDPLWAALQQDTPGSLGEAQAILDRLGFVDSGRAAVTP